MVENYTGLTTDNSAEYSHFEKLRTELDIGDELITYKPNSDEIDLEGIIVYIHETLPFLILRTGNKYIKCTTLRDLHSYAYVLDKFETNKDAKYSEELLNILINYSNM